MIKCLAQGPDNVSSVVSNKRSFDAKSNTKIVNHYASDCNLSLISRQKLLSL